METTDLELVERSRRRDAEAFGTLVTRHQQLVFGVVADKKETMYALKIDPPSGGGKVKVVYPFAFSNDEPSR